MSLLLSLQSWANDDAAVFNVFEYRVRGNTVLDSRAIEKVVYPFLGPGKTIDVVNEAGAALEEAYRQTGYPTVTVYVPEQDVANGVVQLNVTEGRLARVDVTGARYFANGWIRSQLPEAQPGTVPRLAVVQEQLRSLNSRSADRSVTPVLRPGKERGSFDLDLKVDDQLPLHFSTEVNNRNSADTSDTRLYAGLSYDNLWQRDHSIGLQYQVAPEDPDEYEVWIASYLWRFAGSGKSLSVYAVDSNSNVLDTRTGDIGGGATTPFGSIGDGRIYAAQLSWPLPPSSGLRNSLRLGAAYKDFTDKSLADDQGTAQEIDYVNWLAGYSGVLPGESHTQTLGATVNFGIRGLANEQDEFSSHRAGASPNYIYLSAYYDIRQRLPHDAALYWGVTGQLSPEPLISNEQFSAGGLDSVRGYFESEVRGDYGLQSTTELQSPNLGPRIWAPLQTLQALIFVDWASLWVHDALPDEDSGMSIWSAGAGLRLNTENLAASLEWAIPFEDGNLVTRCTSACGPGDAGDALLFQDTEAGHSRLLFKIRYGF